MSDQSDLRGSTACTSTALSFAGFQQIDKLSIQQLQSSIWGHCDAFIDGYEDNWIEDSLVIDRSYRYDEIGRETAKEKERRMKLK